MTKAATATLDGSEATKPAQAQAPATPLADVRTNLVEATAGRASLESELAAKHDRIREAAEAGDMERVIELRRRADDLPHLIYGARLVEAKCRIAYLDAALADAKSYQPQLSEAADAAEEVLAAAQAAFKDADNAVRWNIDTTMDFTVRLGQARHAYNDLLAQSRDPGPVVRSGIHAVDGPAR
jgi:hypothetical protein